MSDDYRYSLEGEASAWPLGFFESQEKRLAAAEAAHAANMEALRHQEAAVRAFGAASATVIRGIDAQTFVPGTQVQIGDNPQPVGTVIGPAPGGGVYINITGPIVPEMTEERRAEVMAVLRKLSTDSVAIIPEGTEARIEEIMATSEAKGGEFTDEERVALGRELSSRRWTAEETAAWDTASPWSGRRLPCGSKDYSVVGLDAVLALRKGKGAPAKAEREPRMPRPGDVWAGPYGVRCRLSLGPDGALMEERIAPNPCPPKRCYRDGRHFIESPAWTLITPAPDPLGEMLPNGFRVGEEVESQTNGGWERRTVARDMGDGWVSFTNRGCNHVASIRRLSPPAQAQSDLPDLAAMAAKGQLFSATQAIAGVCRPAKPLCPCCRDTPLRLVGEAQDVYRCGHCHWTGSAERLAEARKPGDTEYTAALDCPACRAPHHTARRTANGIYACPCGWSGGEQLAKQRRAAKERRYKVGDRVSFGGLRGQVMAVLDGGYKLVAMELAGERAPMDGEIFPQPIFREVVHNVSEADLRPWPKEAR